MTGFPILRRIPLASVLARWLGRPPGRRLAAVDAARGAALLAMATYHATWDLGFLKLTPENFALTPAGRHAAQGIAGSFLMLVGIGLVLMNREQIRWRPFLARLVRVGGAALAITAATAVAMPDSFIFFGILHCIALSSVLALPFLFLPPLVTGLAAGAVIAAPFLVSHPALDTSALFFVGLGARLPETNDWVPLFPWFGLVLSGVALARVALPAFEASRLGRWQPRSGLGRAATFAGRHSLAVYLVHQPVLLALLFGLVSLTGPHPEAGVNELRAALTYDCVGAGGHADTCRAASRCAADALIRDKLWTSQTHFAGSDLNKAREVWLACRTDAEEASSPR